MNNRFKIFNIIKRNLNNIIEKLKKNKTSINTLYIIKNMRFGNYFVSLNNAIIFCEFLGCKRILINSEFIKHNIVYPEYKLIIESNFSLNCIENNSLIVNSTFFFFRLILLI